MFHFLDAGWRWGKGERKGKGRRRDVGWERYIRKVRVREEFGRTGLRAAGIMRRSFSASATAGVNTGGTEDVFAGDTTVEGEKLN
jgi:hypothetical protein